MGGCVGREPRILMVRLSALGDVIHALPALAALRAAFPAAHLGWLVEDRAAGLLAGHPQLDRVHVVPRKTWGERAGRDPLAVMPQVRGLVRELRRERYQVALDFQSNFRSGLLAWLSNAPRRIGQPRRYAKEGARWLFLPEAPQGVPPEVHKIERNLQLLRPLGVSIDPVPRPVLPPFEPAAAALLDSLRAEPGPRVVMSPGVSAFGALKAWREDRFAELARGLLARGARVTLAWGGAQEEAQAARIAAAAPGALPAPRTGSLSQLTALLCAADLFVGVDSGPLHLAAALGRPVLGLYGPKHPGTYGPYWPGHRIVRSGIECSPCRHRRCPREDVALVETPAGTQRISPCMDRLGAEVALQAACELLGPALQA